MRARKLAGNDFYAFIGSNRGEPERKAAKGQKTEVNFMGEMENFYGEFRGKVGEENFDEVSRFFNGKFALKI